MQTSRLHHRHNASVTTRMLHLQARHVTGCVAALPGVRRYCHTGTESSEPESPATKRQNPAVTSLLRILVGIFLLLFI